MFPDRKRELWRPEAFLLLAAGILLVSIWVAMLFIDENPKASRVYYVSDADKAALIESGEAQSLIININTADKETLMKLPDIGPVTAERIIAYREENGNFSSVDELVNIKGISERIIEEISIFITV